MTEIRYEEPVLCYVERGEAWFTTRDLRHQWGDDWNDTPYEHNAGSPYAWRPDDAKRGVAPYRLLRVTYSVIGAEEPRDLGSYNSPFSVELINRGVVAWLWGDDFVIHAGTTLTEFARVLHEAGGRVGSPEVIS